MQLQQVCSNTACLICAGVCVDPSHSRRIDAAGPPAWDCAVEVAGSVGQSGHRLYGSGLSDVLWAGLLRDSEAIGALERQSRVHPQHDPSRYDRLVHYVILMKECIAEVVAEAVDVQRIEGTTLEAAAAAMRPSPTHCHRQIR